MLHKHLFKKYFVPSILLVVGMSIGFFVLFYVSKTFTIASVNIKGGTLVERSTLTSLFRGTSTLTLQQADIQKMVHTRYPSMRLVESAIHYPSTLILAIGVDAPFAYLKTDYGYLALSKGGTVTLKERSSTLPKPTITFYQIISHSEYQVGQKIGYSAIEKALLFIAVLDEAGYQTETVAIDSVDMIACKTKGFEVVFSQSRPVDLQEHEVRQIFRQIKVGAIQIGRLDLRFDKPVVQLPQK